MTENKPRYSRMTDILEILKMMLNHEGVSLYDIQNVFGVSRRTAERMRDSIINIIPQVQELDTPTAQKRWGLSDYSWRAIVSFTPEQLATLEKIKKNEHNEVTKSELNKIITNIKVLNSTGAKILEEKIEDILKYEGVAIKQAPNYKIDIETLTTIRQAIKNKCKVSLNYHDKDRILSPLGLIFSDKIYLVAYEDAKGNKTYNYLLHKAKNIKLTREIFDTKGFNLKEYSQRSFGVFQGEIYNVKLQFSQSKKEEVMNYNFHPTQKIKEEKDGTITVTFKASGDKHIIWHVFQWGNNVKILEPESLKNQYIKYLKDNLNNYE